MLPLLSMIKPTVAGVSSGWKILIFSSWPSSYMEIGCSESCYRPVSRVQHTYVEYRKVDIDG